MIRLVVFLVIVLAIASGLAWIADRPGSLVLNWQGYVIETSIFRAVVILSLLVALGLMLFSLLRYIWLSPALLGQYMRRQRQRRGLDALSSGMIAIGAGDSSAATRYAQQARKSLPNEPLTHLLRAQAARLTGDRATAKRIYESMLSSQDTEQLGLRGLYLEASEINEPEAARHFAARALTANPTLAWPAEATFEHQCQAENWIGALETLRIARRYGHIDKATADRRRAVLLTAQAQALEEQRPDEALKLALDAHGLAKDLVPAAAIAGRLLASQGKTGKAAKVLQKTWTVFPHPELATAYAYARIGDSPNDRLERIKKLATYAPKSDESPIAVATAAIEAREFDIARHALAPLLDSRLTQRVATLMARIEGEQHGDKGRVREWLARAITATRDPVWTADGVVSETWAPVSPVTGKLDAFEWRTPVARTAGQSPYSIAAKAEELVAVLATAQPVIDAVPETIPTTEAASDDTATQAALFPVTKADSGDTQRPTGQEETGDADFSSASAGVDQAKRPEQSDDAMQEVAQPPVGTYTSKRSRKKKKKFQHAQASVDIKSQTSSHSHSSTRKESDAYVAPRAPDDPGPEADEMDLIKPAYKRYRPAS